MRELVATIERIERLTPRVTGFTLKPEGESRLEFEPGQHVSLVIEHNGQDLIRPYSIASSPRIDGRFELCVARSPSGRGSQLLHTKTVGDRVRVRGPAGHFCLREPVDRDVLFISSGTGVSPLRAMLQRLVATGTGHAVTLLFGARTESDILYQDEFESLTSALPRFTFAPTLTQPPPGWQGLQGRVDEHVAGLLAGRTDLDIYVCGHHDMVMGIRGDLERAGFDTDHLHHERYG